MAWSQISITKTIECLRTSTCWPVMLLNSRLVLLLTGHIAPSTHLGVCALVWTRRYCLVADRVAVPPVTVFSDTVVIVSPSFDTVILSILIV